MRRTGWPPKNVIATRLCRTCTLGPHHSSQSCEDMQGNKVCHARWIGCQLPLPKFEQLLRSRLQKRARSRSSGKKDTAVRPLGHYNHLALCLEPSLSVSCQYRSAVGAVLSCPTCGTRPSIACWQSPTRSRLALSQTRTPTDLQSTLGKGQLDRRLASA